MPREPRPPVPDTLQCQAGLGQDPRTGAQAVTLTFVLPNPSGLTLGPDRYLARLVREVAVLAPAIARGDVLELRRNGDAGETVGAHLANAATMLASIAYTLGTEHASLDAAGRARQLELVEDLSRVAERIRLALALLEPTPLPDTAVVERMVTAAMQHQAPASSHHRRPS